MVFKETSIFTRHLKELISDEEYQEIQNTLLENPESGKLIKGSGGIRKLRASMGKCGKRGGVRVIYYWYATQHVCMMLLIYSKNEANDLTEEQLKQLKRLVENELVRAIAL